MQFRPPSRCRFNGVTRRTQAIVGECRRAWQECYLVRARDSGPHAVAARRTRLEKRLCSVSFRRFSGPCSSVDRAAVS